MGRGKKVRARARQQEEERKRLEVEENRRKRDSRIKWGLGAFETLVLGMLSSILLDLVPEGWSLSDAWRYFWLTFLSVTALVIAAFIIRRRLVSMVAAGISVVLVIGSFAIYSAGKTERLVEGHVASICKDGMWYEEPWCFDGSSSHMVEHFSAFDPNGWHGWDEIGASEVVPINSFPQIVGALDGAPIRSLGRVRVTQKMGGIYVMQLKQLTVDQVALVDSSKIVDGLFGDSWQRQQLSNGAVEVGVDSPVLVYCNFTPRPFFSPQEGDVVAFTGIPIAFGKMGVMRDGFGKDEFTQVAYVQCSSVEKITE